MEGLSPIMTWEYIVCRYFSLVDVLTFLLAGTWAPVSFSVNIFHLVPPSLFFLLFCFCLFVYFFFITAFFSFFHLFLAVVLVSFLCISLWSDCVHGQCCGLHKTLSLFLVIILLISLVSLPLYYLPMMLLDVLCYDHKWEINKWCRYIDGLW